MKNIVELREEMIALFDQLKSNTVDGKTAKEMNSCAGKIIGSAKVQLDYNKQMGNKTKIDFLEP